MGWNITDWDWTYLDEEIRGSEKERGPWVKAKLESEMECNFNVPCELWKTQEENDGY
jgi:hypothetical protein